jgi:hypothetical protein
MNNEANEQNKTHTQRTRDQHKQTSLQKSASRGDHSPQRRPRAGEGETRSSDEQRSRKEEMKWGSRVAGGTCSRKPALVVSNVAAVDAVLIRFLVIAPSKLNGSFRFSGHCTAHAPNVSYASSAYSQRGEAHFVFL